MSMYDDFTYGGYGNSMSFSEYIRKNSSPSNVKTAADAYNDYTSAGYGSSMSFDRYCQEQGVIPVGFVSVVENNKTIVSQKNVSTNLTNKVNSVTTKREQLLKIAKEKSISITEITAEEIEEWRIKNGYFWKVVSPSGRVYTEVIKKLTVSDADNYITYNAMCEAFYRIYGYGYVV